MFMCLLVVLRRRSSSLSSSDVGLLADDIYDVGFPAANHENDRSIMPIASFYVIEFRPIRHSFSANHHRSSCFVTWTNQQVCGGFIDSVRWLTASALDVTMAAVCSDRSFNFYEYMVKFLSLNDLSGAF